MISVGDKIEYREDGECVVIAVKKLWRLHRVLVEAPDQWDYAIIVDRGENSRSRYIVCVYSDDYDENMWISPYFTSCLAEAATEYNVLTTNKED